MATTAKDYVDDHSEGRLRAQRTCNGGFGASEPVKDGGMTGLTSASTSDCERVPGLVLSFNQTWRDCGLLRIAQHLAQVKMSYEWT